jgi:4-methylaminobutanoate oxidase (formaldehyde-forming)
VKEELLNDTMTVADVAAGADGPLPARASVVVIGAGMIGTSVAHHLAEAGVKDVVVLERHRLSSGTTWHPAGLLASARGTHALTDIAGYSLATYASLEQRTGIDVGYNPRGCITVARTDERMTELRYAAAIARHHDIPAEELAPAGVPEHHPLVDPSGLAGAVRFAADGTVNPGRATLALAKLAADAGVQFREGVRVDDIVVSGGRIEAVVTSKGTIACDSVALCAGLWSGEIARKAGASLALHAAEHMWALTEPIDGVHDDLPYIRDLEGHFYVRPYRGALVVGAFEPNGKPRTAASIGEDFAFGEFEADPEHFGLALERARERFPALRDARIERWLNAPESFTPDGAMLLGETPEVSGLYVAAGMNSQGILMGPGTGKALAEWIVEGTPTIDSAGLDVGRFATAQTTRSYLFERTRETLGRLYGMHWPNLQPETSRGARRTPLYDRAAAAGACFGEFNGWERATWYATNGAAPEFVYSYDRPNWFDSVAEEHRAARERVAVFDLSSFAKFLVQGRGALALMQRVFTAEMDVAVGKVTYTTMLNARGGIEVDLTVSRLGEETFLVVAPTVTEVRTWHWLRRNAAAVGDVTVSDHTSAYSTIAVMGPSSRDVLSRVTDADLRTEAFPFGTAQWIEIGAARALAVRVSFVGELGWELYVPADATAAVYDAVMAAGADAGIRRAGYFALDTLRAEKGFRHWGHDIGPIDTPIETGLGFTVAWDKGVAFIGREAIEPRRGQPMRSRLVQLRLEDPGPQLYHEESVLRDGKIVGRVTSGAYGHFLGSAVGLAFVEAEEGVTADWLDHAFEVDVAGRRVPATLSLRPFYDPTGERMRA